MGWRYESSTPGSGPLYQPRDAVSRVLFSFGVLLAGFYLALFITTLLPETLPEHRTRLSMADRLRERGLLPSWPAAN